MARVCVDCGTPKPPILDRVKKLRDRCGPCNKDTLSHEGKPRELLCHSCVHFKTPDSTGKHFSVLDFPKPPYSNAKCHYLDSNKIGSRIAANLNVKMARYDHECYGYETHRKATGIISPNPLTPEQIERYHQFDESPTAFWLDPEIWDGVDAYKAMFWDDAPVKPKRMNKVVAGAAGLGTAVGAVLLRKKFDTKA